MNGRIILLFILIIFCYKSINSIRPSSCLLLLLPPASCVINILVALLLAQSFIYQLRKHKNSSAFELFLCPVCSCFSLPLWPSISSHSVTLWPTCLQRMKYCNWIDTRHSHVLTLSRRLRIAQERIEGHIFRVELVATVCPWGGTQQVYRKQAGDLCTAGVFE